MTILRRLGIISVANISVASGHPDKQTVIVPHLLEVHRHPRPRRPRRHRQRVQRPQTWMRAEVQVQRARGGPDAVYLKLLNLPAAAACEELTSISSSSIHPCGCSRCYWIAVVPDEAPAFQRRVLRVAASDGSPPVRVIPSAQLSPPYSIEQRRHPAHADRQGGYDKNGREPHLPVVHLLSPAS